MLLSTLIVVLCLADLAWAQSAAEVQAIQEQIHALEAPGVDDAPAESRLKLADLYLDLGDAAGERPTRLAAYEQGAKLAKQILTADDRNAHAHYLYAANLGSAAEIKGLMASALQIREIKAHVSRALALDPDHAPALHMMGMMLEELPRLMGGDPNAALGYLERAVAVDPSYDHARLDLAKALLKRGQTQAARTHLLRLTAADRPSRYGPEAAQLLASLDR